MQDQQKTDALEKFLEEEFRKASARMNRDDHPGLIHGTGVDCDLSPGLVAYTVVPLHGFRVGDIVQVHTRDSRADRLKRLFTMPRVIVVSDVSSIGVSTVERRMRWREWWRAVWRELRP